MHKQFAKVISFVSIAYFLSSPHHEIGATIAVGGNNSCAPSRSKPSPEYKSYYFDSCLRVEFSAYMLTKTGYYYELKDGHVDNEASNCYNETDQLVVEPQLVIRFNCGNITLRIEPETTTHNRYSIQFAGSYLLNGEKYSSVDSQWLLRGQECIYQDNKVEQIDSIGIQSYMFTRDLLVEIHRSKDKHPLNGCLGSESDINLWELIMIGLVIIILLVILASLSLWFLPCRK